MRGDTLREGSRDKADAVTNHKSRVTSHKSQAFQKLCGGRRQPEGTSHKSEVTTIPRNLVEAARPHFGCKQAVVLTQASWLPSP